MFRKYGKKYFYLKLSHSIGINLHENVFERKWVEGNEEADRSDMAGTTPGNSSMLKLASQRPPEI